jgi:hypothetical protein
MSLLDYCLCGDDQGDAKTLLRGSTPNLTNGVARGQRLRLSRRVERTKFTVRGGRTVLDQGAPEEHAPEVLAAILRDYVGRVGPSHFGLDDEIVRTASLGDLVSIVEEHFGCS